MSIETRTLSIAKAKRFLLLAAVLVVAAAPLPVAAALVTSGPTKITEFFAMSELGGGDVVLLTANPVSGCANGYWLRPTDAGFEQLHAMLMMAYAMKSTVRVSGHDDSLWPGSGGQYCRVYWINAE